MNKDCEDNCYPSLDSLNEDILACSAVSLLPRGLLWNLQRDVYFNGENKKNETNLIFFADFIGRLTCMILKDIINVKIKELNPEYTINNLNYCLDYYNWTYYDISYDFSPDGLFELIERDIEGKKRLVRSDKDLNLYNIALKSAILKILSRNKNMPLPLNLERLNELMSLLCIEVVYSSEPPVVKNIFLINNLYAIIAKNSHYLFNPIMPNSPIDIYSKKDIDLIPLVLEIGKKVILMLLGDRIAY